MAGKTWHTREEQQQAVDLVLAWRAANPHRQRGAIVAVAQQLRISPNAVRRWLHERGITAPRIPGTTATNTPTRKPALEPPTLVHLLSCGSCARTFSYRRPTPITTPVYRCTVGCRRLPLPA
jgi:hypothetical protein